jgi:CRISPR system Cascade subunit CasB
MTTLSTPAAIEWWQQITDEEHGDRGARARLRRCGTIAEAMTEQPTILLFRRMGARSPDDLPSVALVAAVLAHVRKDDPELSIARRVGPDNTAATEPGKLSPGRFRRLTLAATPDERLTAFRRLVRLCDGTINVSDCVDALLYWTEKRKTRWVYDYWNAGDVPVSSQQ